MTTTLKPTGVQIQEARQALRLLLADDHTEVAGQPDRLTGHRAHQGPVGNWPPVKRRCDVGGTRHGPDCT